MTGSILLNITYWKINSPGYGDIARKFRRTCPSCRFWRRDGSSPPSLHRSSRHDPSLEAKTTATSACQHSRTASSRRYFTCRRKHGLSGFALGVTDKFIIIVREPLGDVTPTGDPNVVQF